jgi:acetolactate decarboxylase
VPDGYAVSSEIHPHDSYSLCAVDDDNRNPERNASSSYHSIGCLTFSKKIANRSLLKDGRLNLAGRSNMPKLNCEISDHLQAALSERSETTGESIERIVATVLTRALEMPVHTLFQVSTSGALVEGIYEKAVSSSLLLNYGDFGIGTFDNLDGEMVVLDGVIYQIRSDGTVTKIEDDTGTPFAVVVRFVADQDETVARARSFEELRSLCDKFRDSANLFYAVRVDGHFDHVHTRAMKETLAGLPLAQAAAVQPEFDFRDIQGTLVGIWAPKYSGSLNIAGYHFHFLSDDRTKGGHLLECSGENLRVQVERLTDFHLSLPESEEFLRADLSKDPSKDLAYAEEAHKRGDA